MVEVRDLHMHFGAVRALMGVSFTAPDGTITGLLGENGAGKTTTLNIVAGLHQPILAFDLVWLYHYRAESSVREFLLRPVVVIVLTIVTPAVAAVAVWYRRRLQRELKNLIELRRGGRL